MKRKRKTAAQIFNVQFVGDYFVLTTHVEAEDDEQAIEHAVEQIRDHYGWDLEDFEAEANEDSVSQLDDSHEDDYE